MAKRRAKAETEAAGNSPQLTLYATPGEVQQLLEKLNAAVQIAKPPEKPIWIRLPPEFDPVRRCPRCAVLVPVSTDKCKCCGEMVPKKTAFCPWTQLTRGKLRELIEPRKDRPNPPVFSIRLPNLSNNQRTGCRLILLQSLLDYLNRERTRQTKHAQAA